MLSVKNSQPRRDLRGKKFAFETLKLLSLFLLSDNMFTSTLTAAFLFFFVARMHLCVPLRPTLGAVLADEGTLGIAQMRTGVAALVQGDAHVAWGCRVAGLRALLALQRIGAVHPAQLAGRFDIT